MNPWRRPTSPTSTLPDPAPLWTEEVRNALPCIDFGEPAFPALLRVSLIESSLPDAETFVVDWDHLSSHFEALHLSWDPKSFTNALSVYW
jgi:hypothetical protein